MLQVHLIHMPCDSHGLHQASLSQKTHRNLLHVTSPEQYSFHHTCSRFRLAMATRQNICEISGGISGVSFCVQARWWFWNDELRVSRCEADGLMNRSMKPCHESSSFSMMAIHMAVCRLTNFVVSTILRFIDQLDPLGFPGGRLSKMGAFNLSVC